MSLPQSNRSAWIERVQRAVGDPSARARALPALQALLASARPPARCIHNGIHMGLLAAAAGSGWDDAVHALLAAGADVHTKNDEALCEAATGGHAGIIDALLAAGADVHVSDDLPLLLAAYGGHKLAIEHLLAAGSRVRGYDPLQQAVLQNNIPILDMLLAAAPSGRQHAHAMACDAIKYGHWPMIGHVIAFGVDLHENRERLLRLALSYEGPHRQNIVRLLLHNGADAVRAWRHMDSSCKAVAAATLDAMATDIPAEQRAALMSLSPRRFPAMRSMLAADQRRWTRHAP